MILCAGEALVDMIPGDMTTGEPGFIPRPGGSVYNTAIALGRLGEAVALATALSSDVFGAQLELHATASGVSLAPAARTDRLTTLAVVAMQAGQAHYAFYDVGSALREVQPGDFNLPEAAPSAALFGGISLVPEPCATTFETLCAGLKARGVPIMLDPNIRTAFVTDEAAFRARMGRMLAMADIVKVSDEDLAWLSGGGSVEAAAADLLAQGPVLVCVTRGPEGVVAYRETGMVQVPSPVVQVADTVGAGDTFNAGLLAGLSRAGALGRDALARLSEADLSGALALGTAAAAVCVSRNGANPPWQSELG